jgi:two-component system LytT family response regulator
LSQVEQELDPALFLRVHRSVIVALNRVVALRSRRAGGYVIELRGGRRLRSSRQYAERVRALLRS